MTLVFLNLSDTAGLPALFTDQDERQALTTGEASCLVQQINES
jgi:hypothetical protein